MRAPNTRFTRHWRVLLMLSLIPALQNCSRIDGSVELNNGAGEPYSFAGAKVEVFDLNRAAVIAGESRTSKGVGSVTDDTGALSLQVITATIADDALYDVEISCPAGNTTDACNVETPLHVVLSGAQLKANGWKASALTEAVFQNTTYYAAAAYSGADITQMLNNYAAALLTKQARPINYDDVLAWSATETDAVKRPQLLNTVSESLANGIGVSELRLLTAQWVSPEVTNLDLRVPWWRDFQIQHVTIANNQAYITSVGIGSLGVIDISNPEQPTPTAYIEGVDHTSPLVVTGTVAYAGGNGRVQVIDVADPHLPEITRQITVDGKVSRIVVSGTHAYVATSTAFLVFDIRTTHRPVLVGTLNHAASTAAVVGSTAYLTDGATLLIVDVSNPGAPTVISSLPLPHTITDIVASTDYVYLVAPATISTGPGGLYIVDVRNAAAPTLAGQLELTTESRQISLAGTQIYAIAGADVQIIDVSDPTAPVPTRLWSANNSPVTLAVTDKFTYVANLYALTVVDLDIVGQPVVQAANLPVAGGISSNIVASGNYAYWTIPNSRAVLFDLSNPLEPVLHDNFSERDTLISITVKDDYAFLVNGYAGGLNVADISDPFAAVEVGNYLSFDQPPRPEELTGVGAAVISGNYLFAPWGHTGIGEPDGTYHGEWGCTNSVFDTIGGIIAVDISSPQTPAIVSQTCIIHGSSAVVLRGNYAYVLAGNGILQIVDYTNANAPVLKGQLILSGTIHTLTPMAVTGNFVWINLGYFGFEIVDVSNPDAPVSVRVIDTPGYAAATTFNANYAYVADGASGVLIFDITNPAAPLLIGNANTVSSAFSVFLHGDYLYAATGYGLEIFKALPAN